MADATASQSDGITIGSVAVLDGTASSDADGDSLTFAWSLISAPDSSATELIGSGDPIATIAIDVVGSYAATLVVNDGIQSSDPDTVTVTAIRGAPRIALDDFPNARSFGELTLVFNDLLTVSGPVDDPDATVTVNGTGATVSDLRYTADVALTVGHNDVTVLAENPAGQTSVTESVTYIGPGSSLRITSPRALYGAVYDAGSPVPVDIPVNVTGVATASLLAPDPVITVNGVTATVTPAAVSCVVVQCFRFEAGLSMPKGPGSITASAGVLSETVNATIDYCLRRDRHAGVASEVGNQGNRCHEIDGCSVYIQAIGPLTPALDLRNDPMPLAVRNVSSTEFGSGVVPPEEFFVHGLRPARNLPCNLHDVCYQTLGETQAKCDDDMYVDMKEVCFKAYPPSVIAPLERAECYATAWVYYQGLRGLGEDAHAERQEQYSIG